MKFMENSELDVFSQVMVTSANGCMLDIKLEQYSAKSTTNDKKQWKDNDKSVIWCERQPLGSPEEFIMSGSPSVGHYHRMRHMSERSCSGGSDNDADECHLKDSISRKRLYDLTQVLNSAYPDHDFSQTKSEAFAFVNYTDLSNVVDTKLDSTVRDYALRKDELWRLIEETIEPRDCEIYSFKSQFEDDPFAEDGLIWALAFIFYNKPMKRFVLFTVRCLSKTEPQQTEELHYFVEDDESAPEPQSN